MNKSEVQNSWGWFVIWYIFLAGLGSGTYFFSFLMLNEFTDSARIGVLIGPVLVLFGTLMLIFDLGSPSRAFRLFISRSTLLTSWMARGAWILAAFIILGLAYALPGFKMFDWLPWGQTGWGSILGLVAVVLSVVVMLYPGLLLGVIKSIPLWNTSALPILFLASGLDTGMAAIVLLSLVSPAFTLNGLHLLAVIDVGLILMVLIMLGIYIEIIRKTGETAADSVRVLLKPVFVWGVTISGLLIPLLLLLWSLVSRDVQIIYVLETTASILVLSGGLLLRFSLIKSGLRLSVM